MALEQPTFSESWHRVADQRLRLRPDVVLRRQNFRGERWFVVEDPFSNRYFRIRPEAYEFLVRLGPDRTVEEAWKLCLEMFPESAPGQQECINLLAQFYKANLLHYDMATDAAELFRRQSERKSRELRSRLLGIMFARIPLFDPDRLLKAMLPWFGKLISLPGLILWLIVVGLGAREVVNHWPQLVNEGKSVIDPENLFLLYLGLVIAKTLHEFGHGLFCRKFGGEVHTMGVMLLIFTPVPYVDVTSSWSFRSRRERILVSSAGMLVEVFLAALAAMLWARSGSGAVHSVCYNIMFVASVSTVLFNINPLLRFDGYYMLSDWLDIPNLHQRATAHLKHLWKSRVFGLTNSRSPASTRREAGWLTVFGILSGIYRILVFTGILLFVADRFLILGLIMLAVCLIGWFIVPVFQLLRYLSQSPELDRHRQRAWLTTLGVVGGVFAFLQFVPFPAHFKAEGIVHAKNFREVVTEAPGFVKSMPGKPGATVSRDGVLLELENVALVAAQRRSEAQLQELETRILAARSREPGAVEALQQRRQAAMDQDAELKRDAASLTVKSTVDGLWSFLPPGPMEDLWLPRGTSLGVVADPDEYEMVAAVRQTDADRLFGNQTKSAEVKLTGQSDATLEAAQWEISPGGRRQLPSIRLGSRGGGEIPVRADDQKGRQAAEPFYLVRAALPNNGDLVLKHGQIGAIRFRTGWEPLLPRWVRQFRQFLQERYRL